jgi:probable HAF family extracellular repeat protein
MSPSVPRRFIVVQAALSIALIAAMACRGDPTLAPSFGEPNFAKGGPASSDPTVTSTTPSSAPRDTTLNVIVGGSGFDQGTRAVWALDGDTALAKTKVKTNTTTFVNPKQLIANITIAVDATIDLYDVQVVTLNGRKGIGIELFAVTPFTATVLPTLGGNSGAQSVNDNGVIVGYSAGGGVTFPVKWTQVGGVWQVTKLQTASGSAVDVDAVGGAVGTSNGVATYWPAGGGVETIGPGSARAMNDAGTVVGYRSGAPNGGAVAWTRSGGAWVEHTLPRQAGVVTGFNEVDDISNDGVIVGYAQGADGVQHAVKWIPSTTTAGEWDPAVPVDARAGTTNSAALGIDGPDIVGIIYRCTTQCTSREGFHWSTTGAALGSLGPEDAVPEGLNSARTIAGWFIVNARGQYWRHAFIWSPSAPAIQDLGLLKGDGEAAAHDINNATASRSTRLVVGESVPLRGTSSVAMLWTIR